jgi:hypothetical protein
MRAAGVACPAGAVGGACSYDRGDARERKAVRRAACRGCLHPSIVGAAECVQRQCFDAWFMVPVDQDFKHDAIGVRQFFPRQS